MSEELVVIQPLEAAVVVPKGKNYVLTAPTGTQRVLRRDTDFGNPVNEKTGKPVFPQPILYKGGAEQIIRDYKMLDRYTVESATEDAQNGYFAYRVKCSLVAYNPATGQEVTYTEGVGCANTRESKTGNQSGFDAANSALKKAKKRAMVDAAISLAGLSSIFTQDIDNDQFMKAAAAVTEQKPEDLISAKQRQRIFAIAANHGMTQEQTRNWLKAQGFASTKEIKQEDYDGLCEKLEEIDNAG